jgi:hypothetical protein
MDLKWYNDLNEWFPDRDQNYVPIWGAHWSDYSGCGWIVILDRGGQLYKLEGGYNPMCDNSEPAWDPWPVTYDQAIEDLEIWEEHLD